MHIGAGELSFIAVRIKQTKDFRFIITQQFDIAIEW